VKFIERALLLSHESLAGSPGELREGAETASCSHGILQHAPAAFAWVEMVLTHALRRAVKVFLQLCRMPSQDLG
jgi:hypothetical protein